MGAGDAVGTLNDCCCCCCCRHRRRRNRRRSSEGAGLACATAWKITSRFLSSSFCFFSLPNMLGIIFLRHAHTSACTLAIRARLTCRGGQWGA
jgi:hypothetical protein